MPRPYHQEDGERSQHHRACPQTGSREHYPLPPSRRVGVLLGHVFGQVNPASDFPRILSLYRSGALRLDELITRRYPLAQINEGYADMHNGQTVRGLVEHR